MKKIKIFYNEEHKTDYKLTRKLVRRDMLYLLLIIIGIIILMNNVFEFYLFKYGLFGLILFLINIKEKNSLLVNAQFIKLSNHRNNILNKK